MSRRPSNDTVRSTVEALVKVEKALGEARKATGASWEWAPYSRPSTGGPFAWNDIIVTWPGDGGRETMPAYVFIERSNA